MYKFESLLRAGVSVAAMSDELDGDCALNAMSLGSRARFLKRAGAVDNTCFTQRQVHGNHITIVTSEMLPGDSVTMAEEGDGLITATPGVSIGVTVADCVPVLLFDPVERVVAAIHAGRAGTVARISHFGVQSMKTMFNVNTDNIRAVIGPSAGPCCYEVSEELTEACAGLGVVAHGRLLDLWESNRVQLIESGLDPAHIEVTGHCTLCSPGYWSYRRQETSCRNLAVIGL